MNDSDSSSRFESNGATTTSRTLLVKLKDNDREAWERLVHLYTPLVCYWCRKLDLPVKDTPDVVQETFKAVSQNIERFRKERPSDTFRGWLRVIVRNKVMDHYRRARSEPAGAGGTAALERFAALPAGVEHVAPEDHDTERRIVFRQALDAIRGKMSDQTWRAFWRVAIDECSPADVADELGMTSGAVRVAKCRVLQRLRQELGEFMDV